MREIIHPTENQLKGKSSEPQNTTLRFPPGHTRPEEHGRVSWNADSRDLEPRVVQVAGP